MNNPVKDRNIAQLINMKTLFFNLLKLNSIKAKERQL